MVRRTLVSAADICAFLSDRIRLSFPPSPCRCTRRAGSDTKAPKGVRPGLRRLVSRESPFASGDCGPRFYRQSGCRGLQAPRRERRNCRRCRLTSDNRGHQRSGPRGMIRVRIDSCARRVILSAAKDLARACVVTQDFASLPQILRLRLRMTEFLPRKGFPIRIRKGVPNGHGQSRRRSSVVRSLRRATTLSACLSCAAS